jgi:hypothetical protein
VLQRQRAVLSAAPGGIPSGPVPESRPHLKCGIVPLPTHTTGDKWPVDILGRFVVRSMGSYGISRFFFQAGHPDFKKLVHIGAEDAQELEPLQ